MGTVHAIAAAFQLDGQILDVVPYGDGIINDTYLVDLGGSNARKVILQRINQHVFPEPTQIMTNLRIVLDHMRARQAAAGSWPRELRLPQLYSSHEHRDFVTDAEGSVWRALSFIHGTASFTKIENVRQAGEVGYALGRFHLLLQGLEPHCLHDILPEFHITPRYLDQFMEAVACVAESCAELDWCFDFVEKRSAWVEVLEDAKRQGILPLRIIHGDPKLSNILFDNHSGCSVSLIDLDTVKPGLIQYDIGDCLRSCCNLGGETPSNLTAVDFDLEICQALLQSYVGQARDFLNPQDYSYFYDAIRLIAFELGLRFLTDYLQGDRYFKIHWPQQNLHRAMAQFTLTQRIECYERRIRRLIRELSGG